MAQEKMSLKEFWDGLDHFSPEEFDSPDSPGSGKINMNREFMIRLNLARKIAGIPFVITSGYRTKAYNNSLKGSAINSSHLKGRAADIMATNSKERFKIVNALQEAGFNRMGINFDRGFIHVDDDPSKPKDVIWGY